MARISAEIGEQVLAFLLRHQLRPTPDNYWLGYQFLSGENKELTGEVSEYDLNGLRIKQVDADDLFSRFSGSKTAIGLRREEAVDSLIEAISEIAQKTSESAGSLGRDLQEECHRAAAIEGSRAAGALIARIVERAETAERELHKSSVTIDYLKHELEHARNEAEADELTGLPNRRYARKRLEELSKRAKTFHVAIIDIDNFKLVNDTFGHSVGDRVINLIGKHLTENLPNAYVARWGGEEFLVAFQYDELTEAFESLDSARNALANRRFRVRETDQPLGEITFSAGIATDPKDWDHALKLADEYLYNAKRAGRNRVYGHSFSRELCCLGPS